MIKSSQNDSDRTWNALGLFRIRHTTASDRTTIHAPCYNRLTTSYASMQYLRYMNACLSYMGVGAVRWVLHCFVDIIGLSKLNEYSPSTRPQKGELRMELDTFLYSIMYMIVLLSSLANGVIFRSLLPKLKNEHNPHKP